MPERNRIGLDTTVVLRLLTGQPENQFSMAKTFIEKQLAQNVKFFVSDLVISESYFALHYHYQVPKNEAVRELLNLLSSGIIHPLPGSVALKILKENNHHKAGLVDRIIHGQYHEHTDQVVTFDKALSALPGVIGL